MKEFRNVSEEKKREIIRNILQDTDHNQPKLPHEQGGSFFSALSAGTQRFSECKMKKAISLKPEDS